MHQQIQFRMATSTTSSAVPLFQASLVVLSLWLGVSRFILNRHEDTEQGEVAVIAGGAITLSTSTAMFGYEIAIQTSSIYIQTGVGFLLGLVVLIVSATISILKEDADAESYWDTFEIHARGLIYAICTSLAGAGLFILLGQTG